MLQGPTLKRDVPGAMVEKRILDSMKTGIDYSQASTDRFVMSSRYRLQPGGGSSSAAVSCRRRTNMLWSWTRASTRAAGLSFSSGWQLSCRLLCSCRSPAVLKHTSAVTYRVDAPKRLLGISCRFGSVSASRFSSSSSSMSSNDTMSQRMVWVDLEVSQLN